MNRKEKQEKIRLLSPYRDDELLKSIIIEFLSKFKGQITNEEVMSILSSNGFNGLYVLSDDDYKTFNEDPYEECDSVGSYHNELKIITLKESQKSKNIIIGCHELTHALIDNRLLARVDDPVGEISYGFGIEEGIATSVEKRPGNTPLSRKNDTLGYRKNHMIVKTLDLLYQNSKYQKYDSLVVEAIKTPDTFFNLIYQIILDNIKKIVSKGAIKDVNTDDINMMALRAGFVILQTSDMLVDSLDKETSESEKNCSIELYRYSRVILGSLLSASDEQIQEGKYKKEYLELYLEPDLKLFTLSGEDKLLMIIFNKNTMYYERLYSYITKMLIEYVLRLEQLKEEQYMLQNKNLQKANN